jgi:hypothetical protein
MGSTKDNASTTAHYGSPEPPAVGSSTSLDRTKPRQPDRSTMTNDLLGVGAQFSGK